MRPMEAGRLQVIAGPMFAGKTEEPLRRVHRARLAGRRVEVVGHSLDDRGGADRLSTHLGRSTPARMLEDPEAPQEPLAAPEGAEGRVEPLALDEAQFFGPALVPVLEQAARRRDRRRRRRAVPHLRRRALLPSRRS
ncbi:hypothetical protein [Brachybacterium sp. GPGPB12]|uniref:hypothetical protein n=1 Tax=Brachybacterium sp. GPGPB12 TaxID=3023517 RepID=UPI0031343FBE